MKPLNVLFEIEWQLYWNIHSIMTLKLTFHINDNLTFVWNGWESEVMADKSAVKTFGEDEYGRKLDRCLTDTLIKAGT